MNTYANEWVDDVIASQFFLYLVHRNDENPIFQLWESKSCLISTLNKCRIIFALTYFDMGRCLYMFEQKNEEKNWYKIHGKLWGDDIINSLICIYLYQLFKKCFIKNYQNSKFCCPVRKFLLLLLNYLVTYLTWTWFLLYYPSQSLDSRSCYHSAPSSLPGEHSGQVKSNVRGSHAILSDKYYMHLHPIGCPSG